jgi:hypothetical protein
MNSFTPIVTIFCTSFSLIVITTPAFASKIVDTSTLDRHHSLLLTQANLLEGLKQKDVSDWKFVSNRNTSLSRENSQQSSDRWKGIQIDPDVNLRLQKSDKIWDSNGDDEDDAVILDLYQK